MGRKTNLKTDLRIAIIGGGPSALFMFKRLIESDQTGISISIFERKNKLGSGMPYSADGANDEHITNVSGNEIPSIVTPLNDWVKTISKDSLDKFHMDADRFNEYKVLPRLLFGQYLTAQFDLLQKKAKEKGIEFTVHYNSHVTDIIDHDQLKVVTVEVNGQEKMEFDRVIICTGHNWPHRHEGETPGWFDSPYPPVKLAMKVNETVAIKGSSLTAVDAIRTLSRHNGTFEKDKNGKLTYRVMDDSPKFKMVMHTRNGMLPAVRFHLYDSHLTNDSLLTEEEIKAHIQANDGFLSLDYIFENDFKRPIEERDPVFYDKIKGMSLEKFVATMMGLREHTDPFELLQDEYDEAEKSIKERKSIYWKEMLGVLSFALNHPAKHLPAEDMQRLQHTLTPLISIVIAYIPQSSSEEILALHQAGVLDLIEVDDDSKVEPDESGNIVYHYVDQENKRQLVKYAMYVDCTGQPHLAFEDLPFKTLLDKKTVSPAKLKFRSAENGQAALADHKAVSVDTQSDYWLQVPGIAINDHFQVVDAYGALNERIYMMAVPYIGGFNPDYSGLDFSEAASNSIMQTLFL